MIKSTSRRVIGGISLLALAATLPLTGRAESNPEPKVVPAVQQWTGGEGILKAGAAPIVVDSTFVRELSGIAERFRDELRAAGCGRHALRQAVAAKPGDLFLTLAGADSSRGPESHTIVINDRVVVSAPAPDGVFLATRTLFQLLSRDKDSGSLPKGVITDWPQSRRRMVMLDVGRKPFPVPVLKDYLRILSWYKMNELHLHLSDQAFGDGYAAFRVECRTFPGLTAKDLFYTREQLRDLQDVAHQYGITITPEVDMPGHALCFTQYWPDLRHPRMGKSYLDVTNPNTISRMKALLDEIVPLFDAPDFHIGTDEYGIGGKSKEERELLGEAFRQFINTMNAHLRAKGKNCRIWSGFEHMSGTTLPDPTVTIDMWVTDDAKALIDRGHHVINSYHGRTYIVPGCHYYGVSNGGIYDSWEPSRVSGDPAKNPSPDDPRLLGGKLHVWNDQGPTGYTMTEIADLSLDSIISFSEKMWGRKGSPDYGGFMARAALTKPVPGVTVFDRIPAGKDGVVLDIPCERSLSSTNDTARLAWRTRGNLVIPWTLTMDVCRTVATGRRGVILSSDLAEICSNYTRTDVKKTKGADGKEVETRIELEGIGLVRAAGTPGKDPASSALVRDVSQVCSDPLPINQWVTVTVVGERRHTTVYLGGVKTGESGNQMVCPLDRLGSRTGNSFVGKIRNLKVYDHAVTAEDIAQRWTVKRPD